MRDLLIGTTFVAALSVLTPIAIAQGVYKYVDKDGHTVYTDNPAAGRGTAQRIESPAQTSDTPIPVMKLSESEKKMLEQANRRAAALDRAVQDIVIAYNELRAAETRRGQGLEAMEGERQGRRYRPEYWQRQQALQGDIDNARAKLNDAIDRRNELR